MMATENTEGKIFNAGAQYSRSNELAKVRRKELFIARENALQMDSYAF
jgi:hypothetical protein